MMKLLGIVFSAAVIGITNPVTGCEAAGLILPTFVGSHMVLQRAPLSSRIWGWADPGANVSVVLDSTISTSAMATPNGSWIADLPPQEAGADHTILITDGETRIDLEDIAFGDVYLCSGQSNMEMSITAAFNASLEISDSRNYPNIRLATVGMVLADTPQDDAPSKASNYSWARSGPEAMSLDDAFGYFSATCYFFGRELHKALDYEVPIGLVSSCWGGQKIETFSSPDALADKTCGGTRPLSSVDIDNSVDSTKDNHDEKLLHGRLWNNRVLQESMQIWNAMIYPLLNMRFTGSIWYQGEANSDDSISYACRFPAMITDWRSKFDLPDLSFFFVQLAAFGETGNDWAEFRAAQLAATQLPKVGYATAIDIGDPSSPQGSIHPRRKQEVGRRLSLSVRSIEYEERGGLVYTGPTFAGVEFLAGASTNSTVARLSFSPGTADGLHMHGSAECSTCCSELPFQVLNGNGIWSRVDHGSVRKSELFLVSTIGPIFGIRYAWELYPQCLIYNGEGGPDDHTGIPAAPWEWCAYPNGNRPWTGKACRASLKIDRSVNATI